MPHRDLRPEDVTAIVDTREQLPLNLAPLQTRVGTLATGDYSVAGLEHHVTIERKSLPDYLACIGRERDRFGAEMQRILAYPVRAVFVEAEWSDLETGEWRSRVEPNAVIGSTLGWITRGVPIILTGTRERSQHLAARMLYLAAKHQWDVLKTLFAEVKLA